MARMKNDNENKWPCEWKEFLLLDVDVKVECIPALKAVKTSQKMKKKIYLLFDCSCLREECLKKNIKKCLV